MKYLSIVGLGFVTLGLFATAGLAAKNIPVPSSTGLSRFPAQQIAQKPAQQPVRLFLSAELQTKEKDARGNEKVVWQVLESGSQVLPGSILRYVVAATNSTGSTIPDLVVIQPVPTGMTYILGSATLPSSEDASITFSIDGSKTFVAKPTITIQRPDGVTEVRPAPAEAYTHVRWNFGKTFVGKSALNATYQVRVR
ncbi:hypothetical protein TUMEXPCC7403_04800 [Tumidithrix helvetica PCC 7403]|uniref:hypothetical protein n=1 Tax=Tumidithrix helvetica TaxID=3457545 RepID=UPI003C97073A